MIKPRRPRRAALPAGKRGFGQQPAPALRVQKLLSAAGIGSRREVERWIREGRLQINGAVPALGVKLAVLDRITLDGRPIRLHADKGKVPRILLFNRSPGEALDLKAATSRAAEHLNLPRSAGRWLAIQPLPPVDGGLEILTDDGSWAHRVSQGVHALTIDYVLRMRGPLSESLVEEFRAATDCEGSPMSILHADAQFGEGFNHSRNALRAGTALVGCARDHRQPLDANPLRPRAFVARAATRALESDAGERAQRIDQRGRCGEGSVPGAVHEPLCLIAALGCGS